MIMHLKCRVRRRVTASSSFRLVYDKMMFGGKRNFSYSNDEVNLNYKLNLSTDHKVNKHMFFVHGLFGNILNWRGISIACTHGRRHSVLMDCRNHGDSGHSKIMTYPAMADDLVRLADQLNIDKFTLLGHSMGGKIVMTTACKHPDRIDGVISVDAAPYDYNPNIKYTSFILNVIERVKYLNFKGMTRKALLQLMTDEIGNVSVAHLMMANVAFDENSLASHWKCNMEALIDNITNVFGYEKVGEFNGPFLSILAGNSMHKLNDFSESFPKVRNEDIVYIEGAGHWVHTDKPHETIREITKFIDRIDKIN